MSNNASPWWMDPAEYGDEREGDAVSVDDSLYIDENSAMPSSLPVPFPPSPSSSPSSSPSPSPPPPKKKSSSRRLELTPSKKKPSSRRMESSTPSNTESSRPSSERKSSTTTTNNNNSASASAATSKSKLLRDMVSSITASIRSASQRRNDSGSSSTPPRRSMSETFNASISNIGESFSNLSKKLTRERTRSTLSQGDNSGTSETRSQSGGSSQSDTDYRKYSVSELIQSLGENDVELPPALERRVRDFKFAQSKRRDRHGDKKPWGIFGLYAHLSDIRADLEWAEDAAWRRQRHEPYLSWSDFEKSRDQGLHNRPWFTYGIVFLCTIMMFVTFGVNDWKMEPLNVNPLFGPSSETLVKCGARQTNLIVNEGEWYRLFSPLILHAGLIHYVMNMLAMWYIGAAVEQAHGFASAAVWFIIPAVGGNILSAICLPQYISVGASGGIFGLIGGCVADISINWNLLFLKTTTDDGARWRHFMVLFWLGFDVFLNCLIGFTPFVDNFTHLGGFMYGLCCGLSTIERLAVGFFGLSSDNCGKFKQTFIRFFGLIASVVTIMVTTVVLVQSDGLTSPCHGCRYISCVPFPPRSDEKWWYCDDCDVVTADLYVAANGTGLYEEIDLNCPNGDVVEIVIAQDNLTDKESVRRELPAYCRGHCDDVFVQH